MSRRTPLWDQHHDAGARLVDFAGWEMPLQYGGIQQEHRQVRSAAGAFDVSHMGRLYVSGDSALQFLQRLLPSDLSRLVDGRMAYTVLCNDDGGAIDDLAVYRLGEGRYLLVVNAARLDTDRAWIEARRAALAMDVDIEDRTSQQAMVAVQGPSAERVVVDLAGEAAARLGFFRCRVVPGAAGDWIVSRSGYTGEDGFEIICPAEDAPDLWSRASQAGAAPVGLAARDTLRLEAGLCLYGHELTEEITPLEAGLGWTLALDKESEFPGRDALRRQRDRGVRRLLVGLRLRSRGIPRSGQPLHVDGTEVGVVTSGTHSPMLESGIAMGYVAQGCQRLGATIEIAIRQRHVEAEVVGLPFVESRVRRTRKKRVGDPPRRQRT